MPEDATQPKDWTAEWVADHQNPINRILHFYFGMPLVTLGIFSPIVWGWYGLLFIPAGYAIMFFGHFVIEGNKPSLMRDPRAILGGARFVIERIIVRPARRCAALFRRREAPASEPVLVRAKDEVAR